MSKQENKQNINKEETQTKQKIVYTNNKYDVLNMFENKIEMTKDGMSGILELQNNSLDIKIKDSYIEQYKVALTKKYENVPTNELNDIPKSIEENGVTYYLVNPIWNISQVEKIEGQDVPIAYNGEMQYEGIKERKIVKSYLATVTYIGTLEKEETESITFNIKYKEMPQEEIEEKTNYTPIVVATAGTGILVISGIFLWKRKKKNKYLIILVNIITIITLIGAGIGIKSINDYKDEIKKTSEYEKSLLNRKPILIEKEEIKKDLYDFTELLKTNPDTVGWLKVNNTKVDLPIVKTTDNKFYLNHNFDKKYSTFGWVYVDYRNNLDNLSKNIIIYGHTYKNDLMFSSLKNALEKSWYENEDNLIIELKTPKDNYKYKIFSIYTTKKTDSYLKTSFTSQEFNEYINNSLSKSINNFNTEVNEIDKILTLSTCYLNSNNRLVIQAKLEN